MYLKLFITGVIFLSFWANAVSFQYSDADPKTRRIGGYKRRPCVFQTKLRKGHNQGRTFLDWNIQQYDISYNYNYNIDCSGASGGVSNHRPGLLGAHFQGGTNHPELLGSNFQGEGVLGSHNQYGSAGGLLGSLFNKPHGGLINNIPEIPTIGNGISQSQAGFLSQGIFSGFGGLFNRPSSPNSPALSENVPQVTTPSDADDIIYNDETATPVNSNYDPVPDAYNGRPGRPRPGRYYNQNSYYNKLFQYSINRGY